MASKEKKIDPELLDELLRGRDPQKVLSSERLLEDLKKRWRIESECGDGRSPVA